MRCSCSEKKKNKRNFNKFNQKQVKKLFDKKKMFNVSNFEKVVFGIGSGAALAATGYMLNACLESQDLHPKIAQYEFIRRHETLAEALHEILFKFNINGMSIKTSKHFDTLCNLLNLLVGYELLIDHGKQIPLHTNFLIQKLINDATHELSGLLQQNFHIPKLGVEICDLIETIETTMKDIAHNVNFQLQLQDVI